MWDQLFGFDVFASDLLGQDKVGWFNGERPTLRLGLDADIGHAMADRDMLRGAKLAVQELNAKGGILGRNVKLVSTNDKAKVDVLLQSGNKDQALYYASRTSDYAYKQGFVKDYKKRFGVNPGAAGAYTYDSVGLLGSTLEASSTTFGYSGSIVSWTVPGAGSYSIAAAGAQGGEYSYYLEEGGVGAVVSGTFNANAGAEVDILVGGQGGPSSEWGGGGGGGSFVVGSNSDQPFIVAGGGGGSFENQAGGPASLTTNGGAGPYSGVPGGTDGSGGLIGENSAWWGGAGGGGLLGNGQSHYYKSSSTELAAQGGFSYVNGGEGGGVESYSFGIPGPGGFGGGGAGGGDGSNTLTNSANGSGGGGGGYSGGGGGGGGGGSFIYNQATNQSLSVGNTGDGSVVITQLDTSSTSSSASIRSVNGRSVSSSLNLRSHSLKKYPSMIRVGRLRIDAITGVRYE